YAHFLKHHWQAGSDYIFTFGPLGFITNPSYDRDLFWVSFACGIVSSALVTYYIVRIIRQSGAPTGRSLLVLSVLILFMNAFYDVVYLFLIVLMGIDLIQEKESLPQTVLSVVLLAVLSFGKFTILGFSVFVVLWSEFVHRRRKIRSILTPLPL